MDASLFFEVIQMALVLERFPIPHFKLYTSTMNPVVHIQYYRQSMSLYQQDDALLCKAFLASLDEGSVAWFCNCLLVA